MQKIVHKILGCLICGTCQDQPLGQFMKAKNCFVVKVLPNLPTYATIWQNIEC